MATTLRQMKNGLRRRMGEPLQGTWGKFRYQEDREDEKTDELADALNDGQYQVSLLIYNPETYPLIRIDSEIPVVSGQNIYALEEDFIAVEEMRYVRGSQSYPMYRRSIKSVRSGSERPIVGGIIRYFDYQGMTSVYISEGAIEETSENTLIDSNGEFARVRVGDIVHNITDDSQGEVISFESGRVVVDGLQGGRSNAFVRNDSYGIATQEENRWALQTYPKVTTTDKIIYSGSPTSFMVNADDVVNTRGISILVSDIPSDYEDDEVILFRIFEDGMLVMNDLGPSELGRDSIREGWNPLKIHDRGYNFPIQFKQNIEYEVQAVRDDGSSFAISQVRLATQRRDRMLNTYARSPRKLKTDQSVCEFPNEFLEAVYDRAKIYLHDKLNPEGVSPQLYANFEKSIANIKMNLTVRDETGVVDIDLEGDYIDYVSDPQWVRLR